MSMSAGDGRVRVAIYTRKSVEDAEEKQFGSIDAQRAMCESFIAAKAAEGWEAIPERFDDCGFSGGNLDRPAFRRLMEHCEAGLVDKILVFRIDRMTRSTKDFCEFDERMKKLGVGFTSVSEPFVDSSSPMGELVVSLIVSFGQWERKTIQERIARHFNTALVQGYFVGGVVPYGYRVDDHRLVPDPATAGNVPIIFRSFLSLRSLKAVARMLADRGIDRFPGRPWTTKSLHNCLRNVRYCGDAMNHGKVVKGRQEPLVPRDLWDSVSALLKASGRGRTQRRPSPESALYRNLVFCGHCGRPMSYRWSKKTTIGVRQYSYFVCARDQRQPASSCPIRNLSVSVVQGALKRELETAMLSSTALLVSAANATSLTPEQIASGLRRHTFWGGVAHDDRRRLYEAFVRSVTVFEDAIELKMRVPSPDVRRELERAGCLADGGRGWRVDEGGCLSVRVPVAIRTVSGRKRIVRDGDGEASARPTRLEIDETLAQGTVLKAIARAFAWMELVDDGEVGSLSELADRVGVDRHHVAHTLRLATLSPRIVRAAIRGELPDGFSLQKVRAVDTDIWSEQERMLGFSQEGEKEGKAR